MVLVDGSKKAGILAGKLNWKTVCENDYLMLQHYSLGTLGILLLSNNFFKGKIRIVWDGNDYTRDYRILAKDSQHTIVAVSDSDDEITKDWQFLKSITEQLQIFPSKEVAFGFFPTLVAFLRRKESEEFKNGKTSDDTLKKEMKGYMNKRGKINIAAKKRYFKLRGKALFYSKSETELPTESIHISFSSEIVLDADGTHLEIRNPERIYYLEAPSKQEASTWIEAMKEAVKDSSEEIDGKIFTS
jgi:hypothetical protein